MAESTPTKEIEEVFSLANLSRIGSLNTVAWICLWGFWLLGFADITADYVFVFGVEYRRILPLEVATLFPRISSALLIVLIMIGFVNILSGQIVYRSSVGVRLFFALFTAATVFGVIIGLIKGREPFYVLDDARNVLLYVTIFALTDINTERRLCGIRHMFLCACGILSFKLLLGMVGDAMLGQALSWRMLLRLSPFFLPMLFIGISLFVHSQHLRTRGSYFTVLILGAVGVFGAQMRGMFVGGMAGLFFFLTFFFRGRRLARVILVALVLLIVAVLLGLFMQENLSMAFGRWGEADRQFGVEYRLNQLEHLLSVFRQNWIAGAGLGYYDPNYEGHEEWLPRPYLVELEYANLLAKLGMAGCGMLAAAFGCLLVVCVRMGKSAATPEHRGFIAGLSAGLVALMVASITNTGYSSAYFHAYVALILASLSSLRSMALRCRSHTPDGV